jgi:hypothetical protein
MLSRMRNSRVFGLIALLATATTASATGASTPAAKEPVPKAMVKRSKDGPGAELPAFMGVFGPSALIAAAGFRSAPGRYAEYAVLGSDRKPSGPRMRLQEVGPAPAGKRWIEFLGSQGLEGWAGTRLLTKGLGDRNVERMVVSMPGIPPMEMPLDSLTVTPDGPDGAPTPAGAPAFSLDGLSVRKAGREELTVPAGKFTCEHWVVDAGGRRLDYWLTADAAVPFVGMVQMKSSDGVAALSKFGTDASPLIAAPLKAP